MKTEYSSVLGSVCGGGTFFSLKKSIQLGPCQYPTFISSSICPNVYMYTNLKSASTIANNISLNWFYNCSLLNFCLAEVLLTPFLHAPM